jgi:hypothetical protein
VSTKQYTTQHRFSFFRGCIFWRQENKNKSIFVGKNIPVQNDEGRKEGRKDGRKEGRMDGRKEGSKDGRKDGRKAGRKDGRKGGRKEGGKMSVRTEAVSTQHRQKNFRHKYQYPRAQHSQTKTIF